MTQCGPFQTDPLCDSVNCDKSNTDVTFSMQVIGNFEQVEALKSCKLLGF